MRGGDDGGGVLGTDLGVQKYETRTDRPKMLPGDEERSSLVNQDRSFRCCTE